MSARIWVLVEKEWAELSGRRGLLVTTFLVPSVFLFLPFVVAIALPAVIGEQSYNDRDLDRAFSALRAMVPELSNVSQKQLFQIFFLRQFLLFLLFIPVMSSLSIATYSIVGEKVSRSLEPLLATPITTAELLLGKALAAAGPAVILTWSFFGLYALGVAVLTDGQVFGHVINSTALCIILVVGPLVAVLGLSLGIITSSRASDPRTAQQIAVVVIIPVVGILVAQLAGLFMLTPFIVLVGAGALAVVDLLVLNAGVALFQRETILTRWK